MYYERFEDLPVWNDAIGLAVLLLELSEAGHLSGVGDLKGQIERAAISISNNIAEGFERGTNDELLTFLYIAKGSAAEVRSMLRLLTRLPRARALAPRIDDLLGRVENVSRQLGRWIESLKDSPYPGKRHQNAQTRQITESIRRRDRFMEKVQAARDAAIRGNRPASDRTDAPDPGAPDDPSGAG